MSAASDGDLYYAGVTYQPTPQIAISPWLGIDHLNGLSTTLTPGREIFLYALTVKAKVGMFDLSATGVFENGDVADKTRSNAWQMSRLRRGWSSSACG